MKIAVTVTDAGMAIHVGGPVESTTAIIELSDDQIPPVVRRYLESRKEAQKRVANKDRSHLYASISFSLVDES
jgi:hypothetical protein